MDISKRYGHKVDDDETGFYGHHYRDINGNTYMFTVVQVGDLYVVMANKVTLEPVHTMVKTVEASPRPS